MIRRVECRGSIEVCVLNSRGQVVMFPFSIGPVYDLSRDIVKFSLKKIKFVSPANHGRLWIEAPYKPATDPVSKREAA